MIRWFKFLQRKRLTPLQRAERAAPLAAPTQAIGHVRARQRATINARLRAVVSEEARARFDQAMQAARQAGGVGA